MADYDLTIIGEPLSLFGLADILASEANMVKRAIRPIDPAIRVAILRRFQDLRDLRKTGWFVSVLLSYICWTLHRSHERKLQAEMLNEAKTKESTNG